MRKIEKTTLIVTMAALTLAGCSKKKQVKTIMVPKQEVQHVSDTIIRLEGLTYDKPVTWGQSTYNIHIVRQSDDSLAVVRDEIGNRYYDNRISIKVTREDGSTFFDRTFTKKSFASCLPESYEQSALMGLVFDRSDDDNLYFAGSVGSPDQESDDYVPVLVVVNRKGEMKIQRDTELDVHNAAADTTTIDNSYRTKFKEEEKDNDI